MILKCTVHIWVLRHYIFSLHLRLLLQIVLYEPQVELSRSPALSFSIGFMFLTSSCCLYFMLLAILPFYITTGPQQNFTKKCVHGKSQLLARCVVGFKVSAANLKSNLKDLQFLAHPHGLHIFSQTGWHSNQFFFFVL